MPKTKAIFLLIVFLIYVVLILYIYWDLPKTFFQQDEWGSMGRFIYLSSVEKPLALKKFLLTDVALHFTPLTNLFYYWQFKLLGVNFTPYALFSIGLHLLNSFLVFYLANLLFRKKYLALASGVLFAANSISHQSVTWTATTINSGGTCLFLLFALIFTYQYLNSQKIKWFYFGLSSLIVSLGFKETSVFLFIFIPIFWLIFSSIKKFSIFKKPIFVLVLVFLVYFGLRAILLTNASSYVFEAKRHPPPPKIVYPYRLIVTPFKTLSQSFLGEKIILNLAGEIVKLGYPYFQEQIGTTYYDLVSQTITADLVSYSLTVLILGLSFFVFKYFKNLKEDNLAKSVILAIVFISLSSLPFVFIPGKAGYFSIFEPRHLYISLIGSSFLITLFIFSLSKWLARKTKRPIYLYFFLFSIPILFFHIKGIRRDLSVLVDRSQVRKEILNKIKTNYPDLPPKAVFYIESDTAYYGLPPEEKTLPFQTGPGRTLLVWYYEQEKYPPCLFEDSFLYVLPSSQGFRFCQGRGFGYFRQYEKLAEVFMKEEISPNEVFAFSFTGKNNKLVDITEEIRKKLHE